MFQVKLYHDIIDLMYGKLQIYLISGVGGGKDEL